MSPPKKRSLLVDLAIMLALGAIAVAGYQFSPLLLPRADLTATPETGCDLHRQGCRATLPEGATVELEISPHPIPVVRPLKVVATINGVAARKVEIDFAGATMNMGYNRLTLLPADAGRYLGDATLPVCVTGRMEWVATLLIETDRRHIAIPFRFYAPREG